MATSSQNPVIQHLRRTVLLQNSAGMSDGQLLELFIAEKDQAAFEALVRRHGPMVWGVCRRILASHHDAEDAFQATFLVLVRKAQSVRPREKVASWLHGVAHNTALKARAVAARRHRREKPVTAASEPTAKRQDLWHESQSALDQELQRLPEKYRLPVILCGLEGKSIAQAARQLGWKQGTLAGRLARARALLARRLASRGGLLSGGSLAVLLGQDAASAGVPPAVLSATVAAAARFAAGAAAPAGAISAQVASLTQGVMKSMLMSRIKIGAGVVLAVALVCFGLGVVGHKVAGQTQTGGIITAKQDKPAPAQARSDLERLQGVWLVVSEQGGAKPAKVVKTAFMVDGKRACWQDENAELQGGLYLDPTRQPKTFDFATSEATLEGIYALDGDTLRLCYGRGQPAKRPRQFSTRGRTRQVVIVLKRQNGLDIHDFRLPDGSKAFPRIVERSRPERAYPAPRTLTAPAPPPKDAQLPPQYRSDKAPARVGEIIVVGNARTSTSVILKHLSLRPGQILDYGALRTAEKSLAKLDIFVVDPRTGIRPTVTVIDTSNPAYKDILVTVQESGVLPTKQAERLLKDALGKRQAAQWPIKVALPSQGMYLWTDRLTVEQGGRVRAEPFRAVIWKGAGSEVTVITGTTAVLTLDKPIKKASGLSARKIVGIRLGGNAEIKITTGEMTWAR